MEYNFTEIEQRWQQWWREQGTYHVVEDGHKQKYYVLNMFPYPSGAGLHVGHPLGYIASDIYARYKRLQGFNVLNPMGYDAYGLPAEQYAIQTGQHPEKTTTENINRYRSQLDKIGFSFDWDREVRTCDPAYYKWTQWAFVKMFHSYYDMIDKKAQPIEKLVRRFKIAGNVGMHEELIEQLGYTFTADEWNSWDERRQQEVLMNYRIAYLGETMVNWCPALGTVLANDEVVNGVSERGGYPVEQKKMRQWCLRVSAYAQRLLDGLDTIQWTDSLKETQRNWIGRSEGTEITFQVAAPSGAVGGAFTIFTTRADTIFGVTFMVLAPESELVQQLTTPAQQQAVSEYIAYVKKRTERDRISDKRVTGVFSGSYAINPFTGEKIPIWISEYVLAGYGTGAIMAVPAHDSRDYAFACHFGLPIVPLIEGADVSEQSFDAKEGIVMNSPKGEGASFSLNGLTVKEAIAKTKEHVTKTGIGRVKVNYRLRDAIFSRQRYWGEPFPIYYKNGMPYTLPEECLPLLLPEIDQYKPTETGEPPLGRAQVWAWDEKKKKVVDKALIDNKTVFPLELCTMPGFAGSSAYYLRYMDPHDPLSLVCNAADRYWRQVDLYVGGTEHATGHLIYSRFWNKFLFDLGVSCCEEPFQRLVNQGMIQGRSNFVYRDNQASQQAGHPVFLSLSLKQQAEKQPGYKDDDISPIHVDVNIVKNDQLDIDAFRQWRPEYQEAEFKLEDDGTYRCGWAIEKMSKSMYNVVNPDLIVERYGADTLRLYEMFLGPVEQSKPWDTNGIDGCHRFLKRLWNLAAPSVPAGSAGSVPAGSAGGSAKATPEQLKTLHRLIKKVTQDIEQFSYNTSIAAFMTAVTDLSQQKCQDQQVMRTLAVLIAPFAPHIAEELWHLLGGQGSVCDAQWPTWDESLLVEQEVKLQVSFNGKRRFELSFPADASQQQIEQATLASAEAAKYLEGHTIQKVIVVPGRMVNVVIK